jgi:hypothetical protein
MSSSPRTMYRPRRRTKKIYIERSPEQADDGLARMDHSIGSRPQKANHTMRHVRLSTIAPTEPRGLVCRKNIEPSQTDALLINRLHDSDRKSIVGPEDCFHCCIHRSLPLLLSWDTITLHHASLAQNIWRRIAGSRCMEIHST